MYKSHEYKAIDELAISAKDSIFWQLLTLVINHFFGRETSEFLTGDNVGDN